MVLGAWSKGWYRCLWGIWLSLRSAVVLLTALLTISFVTASSFWSFAFGLSMRYSALLWEERWFFLEFTAVGITMESIICVGRGVVGGLF
jgi:hypothetical protein